MPCQCLQQLPGVPKDLSWYFLDVPNTLALHSELEGWRGTKFMPNQGKKGVACDCVRFCGEVYRAVGALETVTYPRYVTHGGGEDAFETLKTTVENLPNIWRVWYGMMMPDGLQILPGDLVMFSTGRAWHHLAIHSSSGTLWHCLEGSGVGQWTIRDPAVTKKARGIYRFAKP